MKKKIWNFKSKNKKKGKVDNHSADELHSTRVHSLLSISHWNVNCVKFKFIAKSFHIMLNDYKQLVLLSILYSLWCLYNSLYLNYYINLLY